MEVVGGVDDAVEDGLGDDGVGEQRIPVDGGAVGGEYQRAALSFGDQLVAMPSAALLRLCRARDYAA